MDWLTKYLKFTPAEEREGIELLPEDIMWEASPTRYLASFLRFLPELVPPQCILYLEGFPSETFEEFFAQHQVSNPTKVAVGTVWPKPVWHHVPINPEVMEKLAQLSDTLDPTEIASHLHIYRNQQVLLAWHDAFDLPMFFSRGLSQERVNNFCAKLGIPFKRVSAKDL